MNTTVARPIGNFARSSLSVGLAVSLMGFPATCTGPNQSVLNTMNEKELAIHEDGGQANAVSKPKTWTVYCQREDGAKSKFTVSSELSEHISASLRRSAKKKTDANTKSADDKEMVLDGSPDDTDPFGDSTLECGKLLTLLAIFATAHKKTQ